MTTINIENISGKRLTFYQLIKDYHIQIPIIQRDYAQGRPSAYEVRDNFLNALLNYLEENRKHRDLDFIYGTQATGIKDSEKTFIPLDGQQRLTTLFLLYWYLATKDGAIEELRELFLYKINEDSKKSKFTYETRTSSKEFCDALLIADIDLNNLLESDEDENNSLSKTIKDSTWYYSSWGLDPTIQSMLVMIDAIHYKFKTKEGYFKRLTNPENPVITFQFLDLKEFNLTDDLYIKMNARGIPLSPFENFKARFEQYLKNSDFNYKYSYKLVFNDSSQDVDVKTYFSHKIDTEWANLFWNHTLSDKKKFDKLIMSFFKTILVNDYAGNPTDLKFLRYLLNKNNVDVSYQQYNEKSSLNEKLVIDLITILDLLKNGSKKVKTYMTDSSLFNESDYFNLIVNNEFNYAGYVERIMFHAYCQYLINWKNNDTFEDVNGLQKWIRVIYNLVNNSAYNQASDFSNSIQEINKLIPYSNNILNHITTLDKITGFDEIQFNEEKIKASLILKESGWEDLIYSTEKHGYFNGQIGFILFLSGIEEYFNVHNHCQWSDEDDVNFRKSFVKYRNIAFKLFNEKGLNKFDDYIWERALLAKGDYLITLGSNQSFLINTHRDISWKRLLKRDRNPEVHSYILKQIFDGINLDDITTSLKEIKDSYQGDDWRSEFINNPRLFDYLGWKRFVRKNAHNHGFVLFAGERMSGAHAELNSYSFYLNNLENIKFEPFSINAQYYFATGDTSNDRPCGFIDEWEYDNNKYVLNILYSYYYNNFKLQFYYRETDNYSDELQNVLRARGYDYRKDDSFVKYVNKEDVLEDINELCDNLKLL